MKRSRILGGIILLYCILQGLISTLLYDRFVQESSSRAATLTSQNIHVYQGLLDTFRRLPATLFTTQINYKELIAKVTNANIASENDKEHPRKLLFSTLRPIYESI